MRTKRFFQNQIAKKINHMPTSDLQVEEILYSNSLAKIWDVRQLGISDKQEKQTHIDIKRDKSIELNQFNEFSRIDFEESESEQEEKRVEPQSKEIRRSKRQFGGKIENRIATSIPV